MHAGGASSLVQPLARGVPGWGRLPHPAARSGGLCWWADGQPRVGTLPRLAVQAALTLARQTSLALTSDRSTLESPLIAPVAVTWLAHPPSVHWAPHTYHDDVMRRGAVRRHRRRAASVCRLASTQIPGSAKMWGESDASSDSDPRVPGHRCHRVGVSVPQSS